MSDQKDYGTVNGSKILPVARQDKRLDKAPYQLEIWEDKFNSAEGRWDEIRLVTLGSDEMNYIGKAYDINFTKKVSGELNLEFSLFARFIDTQTGEWVSNYLIDYCYNEAKVKLKYRGQWYDFIVKTIEEKHDNKLSKKYTCQYLPIYELSKQGYAKMFSLEESVGNAIQSAGDFMEDILEDTEWKYIPAGTPGSIVEDLEANLIEKNEEVAYLISYNQEVEYYDVIWNPVTGTCSQGEMHQAKRFAVPASQLESEEDYIFGVPLDNAGNLLIEVDEDLILYENLKLIDRSILQGEKSLIWAYNIQVPKESIISEWIRTKIGATFENNNQTNIVPGSISVAQYCVPIYFDTDIESDLGEYTKFVSRTTTYGNSSAAHYSLTEDELPSYACVITDKDDPKNRVGQQLGNGGDKYWYGATLQTGGENKYYFFESKELPAGTTVKIGFPLEETKTLDSGSIYIQSLEDDQTVLTPGNYIGPVTKTQVDESKTKGTQIEFNSANGKLIINKGTKAEFEIDASVIRKSGDVLPEEVASKVIGIFKDAIVVGLTPKTYYKRVDTPEGYDFQAITDLAIESSDWSNCYELILDNTNVTLASSSVYSIQQILGYIDGSEYPIVVGYAPVGDYSNCYVPSDNGSFYYDYSNQVYTGVQPENFREGIDLRYDLYPTRPNKNYFMSRSLEASKSNCLDLTQKVSETFQVWCKYIIEHDENGRIKIDENNRRLKWVTLTSEAGKDNQIGFTYGINLSSWTRTIKTDTLVTKLYVEYNENSNVKPKGYVAIADAKDNPSKENIIYNFDYFTSSGILDKEEVWMDLYNLGQIDYDNINQECYIENSRNINNPGYLTLLGSLNLRYDEITNRLWGEAGLDYTRKDLSAQISTYAIMTSGIVDLEQMEKQEANLKVYNELKAQYVQVCNEYDAAIAAQADIVARKAELDALFTQKYARFIQEGSWTSSQYIDADQYYADALKVSSDGAKPNVEYSVQAVDLYPLDGYEEFNYEVGDVTWIEDVEYFGYITKEIDSNGQVHILRTPYHEKVTISEIKYQLEDPSKTQITIKNYSNKFEDLFQTLAATASSYQLNQSMYGRASKFQRSGAIAANTMQQSFNDNKALTILNNNMVKIDDSGIIVGNGANKIKFMGDGFLYSSDGGNNWKDLKLSNISTDGSIKELTDKITAVDEKVAERKSEYDTLVPQLITGKKLLWVNPNIGEANSGEFKAQTINISDLDKYNLFAIEFSAYNMKPSQINFYIKSYGTTTTLSNSYMHTNNTIYTYARNFKILSTGFEFQDGYGHKLGTTGDSFKAAAGQPDYCVPCRIWGFNIGPLELS